MLEDGKPMSRLRSTGPTSKTSPPPTTKSPTPTSAFGSADASDVRKNGRRYEMRLPRLVSGKFQIGLYLLLALSLTMALRYPLPAWVQRIPGLPARLPAWVVGLITVAFAALDLWLNPDRSFGAMLVKGIPESDAYGWFQLGETLGEGRGLDKIFGAQRPLLGVLFAALRFISPSLLLVKSLNALILGVAAMAVFILAKALRAPWAGLGVIAFLLLGQDHLGAVHVILTEMPGFAIGAASCATLVWALHARRPWGVALAGIIAGLGNLTCGELLLALPLTALSIVALGYKKHPRPLPGWRYAIIYTLAVSVILLPWMGFQKARFGIFTLSMNNPELLAGGADPIHGKLTFEMHREANDKGFTTYDWPKRYRYFTQLYIDHVKADPLGYAQRVIKASAQSLEDVRTNDHVLRTLLALAILGTGLLSSVRSRSPLPLLVSTGLTLLLASVTGSWPAAIISLSLLALPLTRWRGSSLIALGLVVITLLACIALCGLSGNVASRRFWGVADWALVMVWFLGITSALRTLFAFLARVPWFGPLVSNSAHVARAPTSLRSIQESRPLAIGLVGLFAIALTLSGIRQLLGSRPPFTAAQIAPLLHSPTPEGQETHLLQFDDFLQYFGPGEHITHWAPFYRPVPEARWIAHPREILPDGTFGSRRIVTASTTRFPTGPRWQLIRCTATHQTLTDPISGQTVHVLQAQELVPVTPVP